MHACNTQLNFDLEVIKNVVHQTLPGNKDHQTLTLPVPRRCRTSFGEKL